LLALIIWYATEILVALGNNRPYENKLVSSSTAPIDENHSFYTSHCSSLYVNTTTMRCQPWKQLKQKSMKFVSNFMFFPLGVNSLDNKKCNMYQNVISSEVFNIRLMNSASKLIH
jgi:hypothetical protein